MAWCLYEIARNPKCQERIRSEIAAVRAKKAGEMLSATDLDSMTYTLATLKVYQYYFQRVLITKMFLCITGVSEITPGSPHDN